METRLPSCASALGWRPGRSRGTADCAVGAWLADGCAGSPGWSVGTFLLQPDLHKASRRLGHVEETNSSPAAGVLPRANGGLLLGLKGTISELELHTIRSGLTAGLLAKAERGDLALTLPIGLMRDPTGVVVKKIPTSRCRKGLGLVFATFLKLRSVAKVMRMFNGHNLDLPRRNRHGDLHWAGATTAAVAMILKNPAYAGAFVYGRTRLQKASADRADHQ